jgi:hypothetical protein
MAVQSDTSSISYTGNNSTSTSYAVPFVFLENSHLAATAKVTATGVETVVTLTNHTGAGNVNGGTVRTAVAVPATSTLTIFRIVPATQTTSYQEGGDFPAASHERALDKLTLLTQQAERKANCAIRVTEADGSRNDMVAVANSIIGLDGNKQPKAMTLSEVKSYLALTGTTLSVPAGMKTFADASERALAVPDFTGQLGTQRDTADIYISTGTAAGNWSLVDENMSLADFSAGFFTADSTGRAKFASGFLDAALLASNAVETAKINDAAVTTAKINDAAVTFAKQQSPQYTGFRNAIINGDMRIDQRNAGSSQTFTAGSALAYCVDRFYGYCTGANVTGQRVAGSDGNEFVYRFTGGASVTGIGVGTRLEATNTMDLAGRNATLSVQMANSLLTSVTWTVFRANSTDAFGTLASPTRTQIATGTFTVNSTLSTYNAVIAIPSAATTGLEIVLTVGAQTSGTWTIDNVQLEAGSVATPFESRPIGTELALCQRYFQKTYDLNTVAGSNLTAEPRGFVQGPINTSGSQAYAPLVYNLPVRMRAAPTLSYWDYAGNSQRFSTFPTTSISRTDNVNILNASLQSETVVTLIPYLNANTYAAAAMTMSAEF